jgi:uncharacterized membrane protein
MQRIKKKNKALPAVIAISFAVMCMLISTLFIVNYYNKSMERAGKTYEKRSRP